MKTTTYFHTLLITLMLIHSKASAQAPYPYLFDYTWNLTELRIGTESFYPPNTDIQENAKLVFTENIEYFLETNICNSGNAVVEFQGLDSNWMTVFNYAYSSNDCSSEAVSEFENKYLNLFWNTPYYSFEIYGGESPVTLILNKLGSNQRAFYTGSNLKVKQNTVNTFNFSPNPTNGSVEIKSNYLEPYELNVYSLNGKLLLHKKINTSNQHLDLSYFQSGIYILELKNKNQIQHQKIVKF